MVNGECSSATTIIRAYVTDDVEIPAGRRRPPGRYIKNVTSCSTIIFETDRNTNGGLRSTDIVLFESFPGEFSRETRPTDDISRRPGRDIPDTRDVCTKHNENFLISRARKVRMSFF